MSTQEQTSTAIQPSQCGYCGANHFIGMCPRIAAIEYHPNGTLKRVELK